MTRVTACGQWVTIFLGAIFVLNAQAVEPYQEYRKQVEKAQIIDALKPDLMGEQVSGYDGSTRFEVTDIDLPGNNELPVRLTRSFPIELIVFGPGAPGFNPALGGIANWTVDVPYISGTFEALYNWKGTAAGGGSTVVDSRCSQKIWPKVDSSFLLKDVWQGNVVSIPGQGSRTMLMVEADTPPPMGGTSQNWTTKDHDRFSCIPMKSGLTGEGFLMTDSNGVKYYFDTAVTRTVSLLKAPGFSGTTPRVKTYLLASKVEDRFGNYVNYVFNAAGQPSRIESNDGRLITLTYTADDLTSAVANGRTWTYDYTSLSPKRLSGVTLPDGSGWAYQESTSLHVGAAASDGEGTNCFGDQVPASYEFTVVHPSGAQGVFSFDNTRHFLSGVPRLACQARVSGNSVGFELSTPYYFDVMSLLTKQISGIGLPTYLWSYNYGNSFETLWSGTFPNVPCTTCTQDKTVITTEPDGSKISTRYGIVFGGNEARELGGKVLNAAGSILREHSNTYLSNDDAAGQVFPASWGSAPGSAKKEAYVRPIIAEQVVQEGVTFSSSVDTGCVIAGKLCADTFARPTSQTKGSTLGYSRIEKTQYYDNSSVWVQGQVAKSWIDGVLTSEVVYDGTTALPMLVKSFGKTTQVLTYHADGTVATVADGNNNVVSASSWKRGLPQLIQYPATPDQPAGESKSIEIRDEGWVGSVTDENGFSTAYEYDPMGRVRTVIYPSGDSPAWVSTTQAFTQSATADFGLPVGHWKQSVSTGNASRIVRYDAMWRPVVSETFDAGAAGTTRSIVVNRYDMAGRVAFQSYPVRSLGSYLDSTLKGVRTEYDALGRVTATSQDSEIGVLTNTTEYLAGFKSRTKSPRQQGTGDSTTTSFMAWDTPTTDYPVSIVAPEGVFITMTRDIFGKPLSLKRGNQGDGISVTRSYVYNAAQELCKSIEPETNSTLMGYDGAGNLAWSAAGQANGTSCDAVPVAERTQRIYDARNRVKSLIFPDNRGNTTYSYEPDGVLATIATQSAGLDVVTTTYEYNKRRLPKREQLQVGGFNWAFVSAYNGNGHLASQTYPNGLIVDYAPNALGQPTKAGSYASGVAFHPNGGMSGFTYGNGIAHSMAQNVRQLPDRSIDSGGVLDDSYTYDGNGNVAAISDGLAGNRGDRDMTYDGLDRLTATTSPMFAGGTLYTYDVLDNLVRVKAPGRDHTYVYDPRNQLSNVTTTGQGATVVGLGYDPQGNLNNKNGQLFDFDRGNRLRVATGKERYVYDGHGRRVQAVHDTLGSIYSMYGQDGALRYQRDERKGTAVAYVSLNGSQVARVISVVAPAVPVMTAPGYVTTGSYAVQWTAVSSATSYELQERAGAGSWVQVQASAATSKAVSGKVSGIYDYRVRGCNAECGGWSAIASVAVELPPDAAPALTAPPTALNGNYTVSWTTPGGAQTYALQESVNGAAWGAAYSGASTSQVFAGRPSATYTYQVRACNPAGCTGFSAAKAVQVITAPGAAPVLSVPANNGNGSFTVIWSTVATATSYRLEENFNAGAWAEIDNTAATSKAVAGRTTSGVYGYRVKACNAAGCGAYSALANVTVLMPPAGAPAISAPANNGTGAFPVSWSAVSEATAYQIEQSIGGGAWALYYNGGAGSTSVSTVTSGSYSHRGRACNGSGCGPTGSAATTVVLLPPSVAPGLTGPNSTANGAISLTWNAVVDGASYVVEEYPPGGVWGQVYNGSAGSLVLSARLAGTWQYRVKACNASGCGPVSATKVVTSSAPAPPPVPTGLTAVQVNSMQCKITWNASAGATYYELRFSGQLEYSGSLRSYTHDARCPSSRSVRACNAVNCSAWSP